MSPEIVGLVGIGVLFVLFALRIPIAFAMGLVGFLGLVYLRGVGPALSCMGTVPFRQTASYTLTVVPLFILMGYFAFYAGLSRGIFNSAYKWLGHVRGGVGMATIVGCAAFAAACGSTTASSATMGVVSMPEMKKYGYDGGLAGATVASGSTLGILIPPSVIFILYGILTEESIGKLFLAGILPGLILTVLFILVVYIQVRVNPKLSPAGSKASLKEKLASLKATWPILALFMVVMGGIFFGVFTATEAGGIGAFGGFVLMLVNRQLNWRNFRSALMDAVRSTAMIFMIVIGAFIFGYFIALSKIPMMVADFAAALPTSPHVVFGVIILAYLVLGCFIESLALLFLTVPIFYPIIVGLGFDPIWFGVIMVLVVGMATITPPVGINVYIVKVVSGGVPLFAIFRRILPFLGAMIACIIILLAFPQIALFLPGLMK